MLGAKSSGVVAERGARVVEMLFGRSGKWWVQGLMWRLGVRVYARGRSRDEVLGDGSARAYLLSGRDAGSRQGCQFHVNLQFSCSFFLQGEGTPNGRLRERAGRWDVLDVVYCSV